MVQQPEEGNVLHFTCHHCEISLTVEVSLGGVTGPCPSCGESVTAPLPSVPKPIACVPRLQFIKEKVKTGSPDEIRDLGGVKEYREIPPFNGFSESSRERSEVTTVAKMLVIGLLVLLIVLGATYLLKPPF